MPGAFAVLCITTTVGVILTALCASLLGVREVKSYLLRIVRRFSNATS